MKIRDTIIACLAAAALLPAAGCIVMDDPCVTCPDAPDPDGAVHLGFTVAASGGQHQMASGTTRTDIEGHPEEAEELPIEREINLSDFAMYVFAGEETDTKSHRLLYYNYNITDPDAGTDGSELSMTGGSGDYSISVRLPRAGFETLLGRELGTAAGLTMRIVLLANSTAGVAASGTSAGSSGTANYSALPHEVGTTTFAELIAAANELKYTTSNLFDAGENKVGAVSSKVIRGTLPMYGTAVVKVTDEALLASRPYESLYLGEVSLLRSVAKVRVHDAIASADNGYPRLSSSEIAYIVPEAYMLPHNAAEYENGMQVHNANIVKIDATVKATELNMPYVSDAKKAFVVYVPEQNILNTNPVLTVKVETDPPTGTKEFIKTYTIPFTGYGDQEFKWETGGNLLRNHIYDIKVEYVRDIGISLDVTVCTMDEVPDIDIPSFN